MAIINVTYLCETKPKAAHENGELRQLHAFVQSSVRTESSDDAAAS